MAVPENRIVIGLDYGTTYSGIAYTLVGRNQRDIEINARGEGPAGSRINDVTSWPQQNAPKVPSVISYSPSEGREAQWGYEIGNKAIEMVWTKLQLDEQDRVDELELVLKALEGMANLDLSKIQSSKGLPAYPAKEPVDVVADYLSLLRAHLIDNDLEGSYATIGQALLRRTPIDVVLTCPIQWSDAAKAKTFQAIHKAGFNKRDFRNLNEIILAAEPEAGALFVIKSIQQEDEREIFRIGDCIVHCDAGGGTVDVGSFRVKQVVPDLILEEVGLGAGKKCGATYVDRGFLKLLKEKFDPRDFKRLNEGILESSIGGHTAWNAELGEIMKEWELEKRNFAGEEDHVARIQLPMNLRDIERPDRGITGGQLRITGREIREVFKFSVDTTISLIAGQIGQAERMGSRVKTVTLSGGFACSDYLYEEINKEFLSSRRIPTRRPADKYEAWPAVARGAVLYGLQQDTTRFVYMRPCRRNYGLRVSESFSTFNHAGRTTYQDPFDGGTKAGDQMAWMAKTGDLILSNKGNYSTVQICRRFGLNDNRNFTTALMANDDEQAPAGHLYNEIREIARLSYDLTNTPDSAFERLRMSNGRRAYFQVNLAFHLLIKDDVQFWVTLGDSELSRVTVPYA